MTLVRDPQACRRELLRYAPDLREHALEVLTQLYCQPLLPGTLSPEPVAIDPKVRISIAEGANLYNLVRSQGVRSSIEIGLAYGFSTVWLLEGLASVEGVRHIAIDPFETIRWKGIGLKQAELLGCGVAFEWIEDSSLLALPDLIRREHWADFIFIDSRHVFDETLAEFHLADKLLEIGGIMALDDLWMPSIRAVVSYVMGNRSYERVNQPVKNLCVLRKTGEDERQWDHFHPFRTRDALPLELMKRAKRRLLAPRRG